MTWPEEYGGLGLDSVSHCLVQEEIAKELPVLNISLGGSTTLCGNHFLSDGTEEQKRKYLPRAAKGELIMATGTCEPVGGSNFAEFQTRAALEGDHYVINGAKIFTTSLAISGAIIVSAVTAPQVNPITGEGMSWIIIDEGTPGVEIGQIEEKLGWHGSSTGSLFLKNVRVPRENLLGREHVGNQPMIPILSEENMNMGCWCLGQAESLYLRTWEYTPNRIQMGKSLYETSQVIRHKLLKMHMEIEALRALVYGTATELDSGRSIMGLGHNCKFKGVEVLELVGREAITLHGGIGVVSDNLIDTGYRDARVTAVAGISIEQLYELVIGLTDAGILPVL